jgi:hypothetical protein
MIHKFTTVLFFAVLGLVHCGSEPMTGEDPVPPVGVAEAEVGACDALPCGNDTMPGSCTYCAVTASSCRHTYEACKADASCMAYSACAGACADQACVDACGAANPSGAARYGRLLRCWACRCPTACNVASYCN